VNNFEATTAVASSIVVSNFGTIVAGGNPQSNGIVANGIWVGYGNGGSSTTNGTVVVDNNANVTATSAAGDSGIVAFNNSNGNVTVNEGPGTTITGAKYGVQATANNRGSAVVNGSTNGTGSASGDVTINLAQNVTLIATNNANGSFGIFAENFNNLEGNITVNMSAGDVITSTGAGINVYDGALSLVSGTILVNAAGTINSGTFLNGSNTGQPAGILAGYLGTNNGSTPATIPVPNLNGNVIINSSADINAAGGDGIRGYTYSTGDVTINATAGAITALYLNNPIDGTANGYGDGISAQNNGPGSIYVTTAAAVSIHAGGSGIAANDGDSGTVSSGSLISVIAYGTIESGMNSNLKTGSGNLTAGILAGYNFNSTVTGNVHGNVVIDDHAKVTADVGDGIRGYNYGTGDVTITVENDSTVHGARYGVAAFTFNGGHVSLTNYGSVTGGTDAIDVNVNGSLPSNGTATLDNHGHINGNIAAFNTTFTNETLGDWSLTGTSTFSGTSTLANAGTIESNGTSAISGLTDITNAGTIEVQSGSLVLDGTISGAGTLKIDAGATLELASGVSSNQTVMFAADTGVLKLDDPQDFHGAIAGMSQAANNSDILRLEGLAGHNVTATSSAYDSAHGTTTLTVSDGIDAPMTFTLEGDYSASTWLVTDKGNGEFDIVDPPASSSDPLGSMIMHDPGQAADDVTIGRQGSSELAAGSDASVTFADATGQLVLDDASNSTISVSGFTGDGRLAGSDQIDLEGIDHNSQTFAENYDATKGLLSVTDGNKTATLQFNGTYQAANFKFVSDGHGGTIVYDPPVANNPADGQHTNSVGGDCFAFNLRGVQPFIQHAFEEVQDALGPLKDLIHIPEHSDAPAGTAAFGLHQPTAIGAAWTDTLKLLTPPHTDLHV